MVIHQSITEAMRRRDYGYIGERLAEAIAVIGVGIVIGVIIGEVFL